jgi:hypothetical protein
MDSGLNKFFYCRLGSIAFHRDDRNRQLTRWLRRTEDVRVRNEFFFCIQACSPLTEPIAHRHNFFVAQTQNAAQVVLVGIIKCRMIDI